MGKPYEVFTVTVDTDTTVYCRLSKSVLPEYSSNSELASVLYGPSVVLRGHSVDSNLTLV